MCVKSEQTWTAVCLERIFIDRFEFYILQKGLLMATIIDQVSENYHVSHLLLVFIFLS